MQCIALALSAIKTIYKQETHKRQQQQKEIQQYLITEILKMLAIQ